MIVFTDIKRHYGVPFSEYQKMHPVSNSYLKHEVNGEVLPIQVTQKIRIGSLVDGIFGEIASVNMLDELYPIAKLIAADIKKEFGSFIKTFERQVSITAKAEYMGHVLEMKGRPDFILGPHANIDLKITWEKDVDAVIRFRGYKDPCWLYSKLTETPYSFLLVHSVPLKRNFIKSIDVNYPVNNFYGDKILKFGTRIHQPTHYATHTDYKRPH